MYNTKKKHQENVKYITFFNVFKKREVRKYLICPCPLNLGAKFLHALMQATVAAKLGLNGRQVRAPLSLTHPPLVLL